MLAGDFMTDSEYGDAEHDVSALTDDRTFVGVEVNAWWCRSAHVQGSFDGLGLPALVGRARER
jgi:hypothetical protein